jgi:hypothetical protein
MNAEDLVFLSIEYSSQLLERIPIRYILNQVESFQGGNAYKSIYSDLLALSANLFPELFDIQSFLIKEGKESESDPLWDIRTTNKNGRNNLNVKVLQQLLNQWETNPNSVIDGMRTKSYFF